MKGATSWLFFSVWQNRLLLLLVCLAGLFFVLFPTYENLVWFWLNLSPYNHCILIIPISLYLVHEKRHVLDSLIPDSSVFGLFFFVANCVLWIVGNYLSITFFEHLAAVGLVIGLIWTLLGNRITRVIAFPLFYLYFCVPEGEVLVPYLRDFTAEVVVLMLRATDIPVFVEGRYLTIPSGSFHVAKACSGINYLIATLAVGTVFAYLRFESTGRRLAFMCLAIVVPIVANGLRAYGIVMIAHLSDYKYAMGVDHFIYGWVFFGIVIFALFALGNLFSDASDHGEPVPKAELEPGITDGSTGTGVGYLPWLIVVAAFALTGSVWISKLNTIQTETSITIASIEGARWQKSSDEPYKLGARFAGTPHVFKGRYRSNDSPQNFVDLELATYGDASSGDVESRSTKLFDEELWRRLSGPVKTKADSQGLDVVHEIQLTNLGTEILVWAWYEIDSFRTIDRQKVIIEKSRAKLAGQFVPSARVLLTAPVTDGLPAARELMKDFVNDIGPILNFR